MHWYLMSFSATRFNHVLKFLADKDINYCCPMVVYHYQRPDKVNSVRKRLSPAFPGYVFVELDLTDNKLLTFSQCRYIQRLIAFGGAPVTVHQKVIDELSNRTFEECKWGPLGKRKISHAKTVFCTIRYRHCVMVGTSLYPA